MTTEQAHWVATILLALKAVPPEQRMDVLALANRAYLDGALKTS